MIVLGIRIDKYSKPEVLQKVSEFLHYSKSSKIFTPNPEMLVDARHDEYFTQVLNSGDLNVCDGFGLSLVSKMPRYSGVDLMQDICVLAEKQAKSVYLLGSGNEEVIKKTVEVLKKNYPELKVVGFHSGHLITTSLNHHITCDTNENDEILHNIIMSAPDILFVAFGHGKQEKWIYENLPHLPSVKIAMGVGGAFDFISGKVTRAPLFLRQIGLEWLYRLIQEPKRIRRIFKATFNFLYLYVRGRK